jgi:ketosteroid isomerase-like protein
VVGVARNAKLGAIVIAGDHVVYCDARAEWPADVDGRPVVVAGTLTSRSFPTPTVGLRDERSAGPEGTAWTLAPCAPPPRHDGDGLIEAERSLFAALARRDREQLERLIAPEFVLRIPGQRDVDRAGFLDSISAMPAGILEVTGDRLGAHAAGDTGIVEGVQVARVRIDGKIVEDRGAFVDVFVKRDGAWRLSFALNLSLTDPAR